jgi:hypothetical protein
LHTSPHASRRDVWQFLASGDLLVKFWWMIRRQETSGRLRRRWENIKTDLKK